MTTYQIPLHHLRPTASQSAQDASPNAQGILSDACNTLIAGQNKAAAAKQSGKMGAIAISPRALSALTTRTENSSPAATKPPDPIGNTNVRMEYLME